METNLVERQRKLLSDTKECYMIGILAEDDGFYPSVGEKQKAITVMKNSTNIAFYVKPLCKEPFPIKEYVNETVSHSNIYVGIDVHQKEKSIFPPEFKFTNDLVLKEEMVYKKLKDKLIIFSPIVNSSSKSGKEYHFKNMEIIKIQDKSNDEINSYAIIPEIKMPNLDFERNIINKEEILLNNYPHAFDNPEYIKCGDYLYVGFKDFIKDVDNKFVWRIGDSSEVKVIKTRLDFKRYPDKIINLDNNLLFIDEIFLEDKVKGSFKVTTIEESLTSREELEKKSYLNKKEYNFIKTLESNLKEKSILFNSKDIINLHINIKTSVLTLISGIHGIGKTTLALEYSKMLNASKENGRLHMVQGSESAESFSEEMKETGDFLEKVGGDITNVYVVIIEDINYIYREDLLYGLLNKYESIIEKGNIKFIATMTNGEETKSLSKEFIDKVGLVKLTEVDFDELLNLKPKEKIDGNYSFEGYTEYQYYLKESNNFSELSEMEIEFFSKLNKIFDSSNLGKISFRTLNRINKIIANIPKDENGEDVISRGELIDHILSSRIISKITGEDIKLEKAVGKYDTLSKDVKNSEIIDLIECENFRDISDFNFTYKMILKKSKEVTLYGYTS